MRCLKSPGLKGVTRTPGAAFALLTWFWQVSDAALSSRDAVMQGVSLDACLVWPKRSLTRESAGSACWIPFCLCTTKSSFALKNPMQTSPAVAPESKGNTAARQFSHPTPKQTRNLTPELKSLKFNFSLISAKLWRVSEDKRGSTNVALRNSYQVPRNCDFARTNGTNPQTYWPNLFESPPRSDLDPPKQRPRWFRAS